MPSSSYERDPQNEVYELQREWRREVSESLKELRRQNSEISLTLTEMRDEFAKVHELERVSTRVLSLENDRAKIVGGIVVLQIIGSAVIWLISKFWKI